MLTLHYHPGNASMAPHLLLEEIGCAFALEYVDRAALAHKSPAYLKLNPNGTIPVLVDARGEQPLVLYEAAAICLHLADTHPGAGLAPQLGTPERAQFYKWLVWLTNTMQARLMHYFYPERLLDPTDAAVAAQVRRNAEAAVGAMLGQLDAQLAAHGERWLLGADYSAADPFAWMLCRWTRGFAQPARWLPHLGPYLQRMQERPALGRVLATEGLEPPYV